MIKNLTKKTRFFCIFIFVPSFVLATAADVYDHHSEEQKFQETKFNNIVIDDELKENADYWGLTIEEWSKFEKIKKIGGRGYWTPNLDPLTTLGVEALTDDERVRYAILLAKKETERVNKEIAFQRIYDDVYKKLYPNVLPIELDGNPNFIAPVNVNSIERLILFIDINDLVRSVNLMNTVLKTGKDVDIYFINTNGDDKLIQAWAFKHNLPVERIKSGNITLNHDVGECNNLANGTVPSLLQQQNGKWRHVDVGDKK